MAESSYWEPRAPGHHVEELDDGGVLYIVEEKWSTWRAQPSRKALEHFQKTVPGIKHYRAKPIQLPDELERMVLIDDATGQETTVFEKRPRQSKRRKPRK
jgi:tRNA(Met) C34 N-acetyltransferase TmcA